MANLKCRENGYIDLLARAQFLASLGVVVHPFRALVPFPLMVASSLTSGLPLTFLLAHQLYQVPLFYLEKNCLPQHQISWAFALDPDTLPEEEVAVEDNSFACEELDWGSMLESEISAKLKYNIATVNDAVLSSLALE